MNEQLQQALTTILNKTIDGIDTGVAFMQSELPDVIEQLLMWYAVKGLVLVFIGFILTIPLLVFLKILSKKDIQSGDRDSFWVSYYNYSSNQLGMGASFTLAALCLPTGIGVTMFFVNLMTPIQIWIAPKIWLIEYAASLAK